MDTRTEQTEEDTGHNEENLDQQAEGQSYLDRFQAMGVFLPHWHNVLEEPRLLHAGSTYYLGPNGAVFLEDLSQSLINLGPDLGLSPEVFASHLWRSGYTAASYADPDPTTWPTHLLPRFHVSLRWFRPVERAIAAAPKTAEDRLALLGAEGLQWSRPDERPGMLSHHYRVQTTTNIFRQEWPLSATPQKTTPGNLHPAYPMQATVKEEVMEGSARIMAGKGKGVASLEDAMPNVQETNATPVADIEGGLDIVAWEERVTFSWANAPWNRVFFFDPLPKLHLEHCRGRWLRDSHGVTENWHVWPFRLTISRSPPLRYSLADVPLLDPAGFVKYIYSTNSTRYDTVAWIRALTHSGEHGFADTNINTELLALLHVVRVDTVTFLNHVGLALDEITTGTQDELRMQKQLEHWRTLLGRFQTELPRLVASLRSFFTFPYESKALPLPESIRVSLEALATAVEDMAKRCQKTYEMLLAEMALLESKRSIAEAESVTRLTELAFFFIPLTFAASLFSIQIREWQETAPPVYAFAITAVVLIVVTYTLRLAQRSTAMAHALDRLALRIRADMQLPAGSVGSIPTRTLVSWAAKRAGRQTAVLAIAVAICGSVLAVLWSRTGMSTGFKAAITVLLLVIVGVPTIFIWNMLHGRVYSIPHPSKFQLRQRRLHNEDETAARTEASATSN